MKHTFHYQNFKHEEDDDYKRTANNTNKTNSIYHFVKHKKVDVCQSL